MKNVRLLFVGIAMISLMLLAACKNDDEGEVLTGLVTFGFAVQESEGGRLSDSLEPDDLLITILNSAGDTIVNRRRLDLIQFGEEYLSQELQLEYGDYEIVEYLVLNHEDEIIYASPVSGSEKALLVDRPLPFPFTVNSISSEVIVEVLLVEDDVSPEDFGYRRFRFQIVETFKFRMIVFQPNLETISIDPVAADLSISVDGIERVNKTLEADINLIEINNGGDDYVFSVVNTDAVPYTSTFTESELLAFHRDSSEILEIVLIHVDMAPLTVADRLERGDTPIDIFNDGFPLDSLFGQLYQGGMIAYLDTITGMGIVAALEDLDNSRWGCLGRNLPGAEGRAIGDGFQNTEDIISANDRELCPGDIPRTALNSKILDGGFDDWHLPSTQELIAIYENLHLKGLGGFSSAVYWSSSERTQDFVEAVRFSDGEQLDIRKDGTTPARPVRYF